MTFQELIPCDSVIKCDNMNIIAAGSQPMPTCLGVWIQTYVLVCGYKPMFWWVDTLSGSHVPDPFKDPSVLEKS